MSREKRNFDPNATIQLEALDPSELVDPSAPALPETSEAEARKTPPPLPPGAPAPGMVAPGLAAPAPASKTSKTIATISMFVVLLAVAIAAGLLVGTRAREVTPTAPSAAAGSGSTAPAGSTLTIPTIEMNSP
jgi:hypothetical protein